MVIKLLLAQQLDLYSDEVFYWLESTHLAPAYSDLPFMTSLLVWLGSALQSGSTLAVRSLFLLLGTAIPFLVYWLALPITDRNGALTSALLSLCVPLGGFLGLLAVPDVPLLFFGLLAIGSFERALRTDAIGYWIATGVATALGLCTHYRFLLYPAAALLYLLLCRAEHRHWRNPGFWLAAGLASLGLLPLAWFNLNNQLASASFYLVERHPWTFQATGLLHVVKQAGLVTPPLYLLLGFTLWHMTRLARSGDRQAALLMAFALINLLVYLILAPWTDASSTSIHWPLSGYFPLLVYAPGRLAAMANWASRRWQAGAGRLLSRGVPLIGYCGTLVALAAVGSQAFHQTLQPWLGPGILSTKMAGWKEFDATTIAILEQDFHNREPVIITDNYYTAAQLQFAGLDNAIFTLDVDKSVRDGRRLQLELWGLTGASLDQDAGYPVLFVTEDSTLSILDQERYVGTLCGLVSDLHNLTKLSLFGGDKRYSYYRAPRLTANDRESARHLYRCPFPARAWIEPPVAGAELSGIALIEGWAYKEDIGIRAIRLLLDGAEIAVLNYGLSRPDVVEVMAVTSDPNAPNLGFSYQLDTRSLANGEHTLAIRLEDSRGVTSSYGERPVWISN